MSNYKKQIEAYCEMFKALSNPNRLAIFLRLMTCCTPGTTSSIAENPENDGCACVGDLGKDLGIVPSTISHHIKELRRAGLIRMERRGKNIECSIDTEAITDLEKFFST